MSYTKIQREIQQEGYEKGCIVRALYKERGCNYKGHEPAPSDDTETRSLVMGRPGDLVKCLRRRRKTTKKLEFRHKAAWSRLDVDASQKKN
jgi:hypothetical protein